MRAVRTDHDEVVALKLKVVVNRKEDGRGRRRGDGERCLEQLDKRALNALVLVCGRPT